MVGKLVLLKLALYKQRKRKQADAEKCNNYASGLKRMSRIQHFLKPGKKRAPALECTKICRICLNPGLIPIYTNDMNEDLARYITTFAGIDVSMHDAYPRFICEQCNSLLQGAIQFRNTAQKSDAALRNIEENNISADHNVTEDNDFLEEDTEQNSDAAFRNVETNIMSADHNGIQESSDDDFLEQNTFSCDNCITVFKTKDDLETHIKSDEHKKATTCPICKQEYNRKYLKKHIYLHNPETKFICDICGRKCAHKQLFTRHRQTHFLDNLPFKCDLCPYKGRYTEALKMHMRSHSGEKPYKCPECEDRTFVSKSNLNKHMLVHKKDFDYKCDKCNKGFHIKRVLEQHVKAQHLGIKEYDCNICSKQFGSRKHLMRHKLDVHKREKLETGRTPLYILAEIQKGKKDDSTAN